MKIKFILFEFLPTVVAGTGETNAVKTLADLFGLVSGSSGIASVNGVLTPKQFQDLFQAVASLKGKIHDDQWNSLDAIVNGIFKNEIDLTDPQTMRELKELQKHLASIHTDLSAAPSSSSTKSPSTDLLDAIAKRAGAKFKLSENMSTRDIGSLLTYLIGKPAGFDIANLLNLKELHHELQFQGGSDFKILGDSIEKLEKGGTLSDQEHADLTHLVDHVKGNHDPIPQADFAKQQSMNSLVDSASDQIIAMLEREFNNGGSLPAMAMKAMGLDLGSDASDYLRTKIFTPDFKGALFSLIQKQPADVSKLDSTQKTVLSVADWGMSLLRKLPKGAISLLPMLNTVGRMFFTKYLAKIPGFGWLYGPLSLAIDFLGVNAKEMSKLLTDIDDLAAASGPGPVVP